MSGRTILADTFAIVTGRSKVQTRAIADAIVEAAREHGYGVSRVEGYADGSWILIDLGDVIVHVFTPEQREFYNLERLWSNVGRAAGANLVKAQRGLYTGREPRERGASFEALRRLGLYRLLRAQRRRRPDHRHRVSARALSAESKNQIPPAAKNAMK